MWLYESYKAPPYHGLVNQGSTCYLNSVLQVLFMTEDFREAVKRHTDVTPHTECIDRDLADLFNKLEEKTTVTHNITNALGIKTVNKQRDAAEYLEKILQRTSSEASQIFRGLLTHKTTCRGCGTDSPTDGPFWYLPLALVDSHGGDYSVLDGIKNYFKVTELSGENQMYCETCDDKSDATMGCVLKTHPDVLMLLLKRFEFDYRYMTYVKIDCRVDVPRTLRTPENETYELYAVVDHYGSLSGGHYVATIKPQDGKQWYCFNDTRVTMCNYQPFQNQDVEKSGSAYLLFYRRKAADVAGAQVPAPGGFPAATGQICADRREVKTQEEDDDSRTADQIETVPQLVDVRRPCDYLENGHHLKPEKEVSGVYHPTVYEDKEGGMKSVRQNMHGDEESQNKQGTSERFVGAGRSGGGAENEEQKATPGHHKDRMAETKKEEEGGMMSFKDKGLENRGSSGKGGLGDVRQIIHEDQESLNKRGIYKRYDGAGRSGGGAENVVRGTYGKSEPKAIPGLHEDPMAEKKKEEEGGMKYVKEAETESRGSLGKGGLGDVRQNMYGDQQRRKTSRDEESDDNGMKSTRYGRGVSGKFQPSEKQQERDDDRAGRSGRGAENVGGGTFGTTPGCYKDLMESRGSSGKGGLTYGSQNTYGDQDIPVKADEKSVGGFEPPEKQQKRDEDEAGRSGEGAENVGQITFRARPGCNKDPMESRGSSGHGGLGDSRQNMYRDQERGKTGQDEKSVDDGKQGTSQRYTRETTLDGAGKLEKDAQNLGRSSFEGSQPKTTTGRHQDPLAVAKKDEEGGTMSVKDEPATSGSSSKGGFDNIKQYKYGDQKQTGKTGRDEESVDDVYQNTSNNVQTYNQETTLDGAGMLGRGAEILGRSSFEGSQPKTRTGLHQDLMAGGNYVKQKQEMFTGGHRRSSETKNDEEGRTMYTKDKEQVWTESGGSSRHGGFGDSRQNKYGDQQERGKTGQDEESIDCNQGTSQRYKLETTLDRAGMSGKGAANVGRGQFEKSQPKGHHEDPMAGGNYTKQREGTFTGGQRRSSETKKDEEGRKMYANDALEWPQSRGSSRKQNMYGDQQQKGTAGRDEESVDDDNHNTSNNVWRYNQETTLDGAGMPGRGAENLGAGRFEKSQPKGRHEDPRAGGNYTKQKEEGRSSEMKKDEEGRKIYAKDKEPKRQEIKVKMIEEEIVGGVQTSSKTTNITVIPVPKSGGTKSLIEHDKGNVKRRFNASLITSEVENLNLNDSPGGDDSDANGKKQRMCEAQAVESKKKRTKTVGCSCWNKRNRDAVTSESD